MRSLLLAFLLVSTLGAFLGSTGGTALLLSALCRLVLIIITIGVLVGSLATLVVVVVVTIVVTAVIIIIIAFFIVFLNNFEIVLESQWDELILELVTHIVVFVHLLTNILFTGTFFVIIFLLDDLIFAFSELFLVRHGDCLEEVEETFLLDSLGDGLAWLSLLCLLLLLNLLLCCVFTVVPFDLGAFAFLDDILASHDEAFLKGSILEVVVLLEGEDKVEAKANCVQVALDVLQVHEDWAILLLDEAGDATVVKHGADPEPRNSEGSVLNVLNIDWVYFNLLVVLVVENLSTGLKLSDEIGSGLLLTGDEVLTLLINLLVQAVVLKLKITIDLIVFVINSSLLVLHTDIYIHG